MQRLQLWQNCTACKSDLPPKRLKQGVYKTVRALATMRQESVMEVRRIFENIDHTRISTKLAQKPKGGEVYVYEYGESTTKGKNLRMHYVNNQCRIKVFRYGFS